MCIYKAADERNYHVFYELLAGLTEDEKVSYGLSEADKYYYLNQVSPIINHISPIIYQVSPIINPVW